MQGQGLNTDQTVPKVMTVTDYISYVYRGLGLNSTQTVFFQAMRKEHLAAVLISIEACRRGSGGRAAVTVSAVWLRDLS